MDEKELKSIEESLGEIVQASENKEMFEAISKLISMPDDEFMVIAPNIMQSFQQSLNNPSDKIALAQSFNASGIKADDFVQSLEQVSEEIDKLSVSVQKRDFLKGMLTSIANSVNETEGIAKRYIEIPIELCHPDAKIPQYAHITDSGLDVFALEDITIHPGETLLVPTGIKIALPPGYEIQVRPKSGRALKTKLRIANTPGTIDAGYRDEIKVIVENIDPPIRAIHPRTTVLNAGEKYESVRPEPIVAGDIEFGQDYTIGKGEKFAQLVLMEVPKASFYQVSKVQEIGEDRGGGFGSTGIK